MENIKNIDKNEQDLILSSYNYQNLITNLKELNRKIKCDKIGKKIEKIYVNNRLIKRVFPLLQSMKEKEINIDRLEKIISSGVTNYI